MKIKKKTINRDESKRRFVRLVTDTEKLLKLTNWREGVWFEKSGIGFDVLEEDNVDVQKQFTVTSRRLLKALKPIVMNAEKEGRDAVVVSILRTGEGYDTEYNVTEQVIIDEKENAL